MNNRYSSSPILVALSLAVIGGCALADPEPSGGLVLTNTAPVATPPPAPAPAPTPTTTEAPAATTQTERPTTYTVVSGDSLWTIAQKFNTSVKALKKANNLTKKNLKPGQVLQIPPLKSETTPTPAAKPTTSVTPSEQKSSPSTPAVISKKTTAVAASDTKTSSSSSSHRPKVVHPEPMLDLDISASTFASCPVPVPADQDDTTPESAPKPDKVAKEKSAPVAELVSPAELTADTTKATAKTKTKKTDITTTTVATTAPAKSTSSQSTKTDSDSTFSLPSLSNKSDFAAPSSKLSSRASAPLFSTPASNWASLFLHEARDLGDRNIDYAENWRPPGESKSWAMDCSNTARYIYKVTTGIQLPRTASDQYYYLHLQNKAWDVPQTSTGYADCNYLRSNLKAGDLLFWENTYKPERQPPITHVMVFLGTNDKGQWIMAGSQSSRGGEHNRRHGGPDIYVFDPTKPCGGYGSWMGLVRHKGRFCAFGRPLEADKSKLAVTANN